jgi:hypothetical protein
MALVLADRVKETTSTTGTGSVTLAGASSGYQSFAVVGNGNLCYYCIADQSGSNWEVGIGTYSTTGPTLARTTVLSSSNSGSLVSFTAGVKDVFVTQPAGKAVYQDSTLTNTAYAPQVAASNGLVINNKTVGASYSIPSGYSAMSAGPITVASGQTVTVASGSRWVVL